MYSSSVGIGVGVAVGSGVGVDSGPSGGGSGVSTTGGTGVGTGIAVFGKATTSDSPAAKVNVEVGSAGRTYPAGAAFSTNTYVPGWSPPHIMFPLASV